IKLSQTIVCLSFVSGCLVRVSAWFYCVSLCRQRCLFLCWLTFSFFTLGNKQRESCGKTCQGDRNNEWMGVSLARQDKTNGKILACAHRWKNVYYESEYILPHGYCSVIPTNLQGKSQPLIPCYEGIDSFSITLTPSIVILEVLFFIFVYTSIVFNVLN
ncbi:hypothetical protein PO909_019004, partial [Leuciscus waleckii]